ncbi:MAG TPA: hypothetical protein VJ872_04620 [Nocardioides sp.]|nr:hypothetical protein [Nocardioides sp.]
MAANFSRVRESRRTSTTSGVRRGFAAVALTAGIAGMAALGMAGLVSNPASAAPGNNGTVKIANVGNVDNVPDNQPHQGCTFTVQWFNFDGTAHATVSFTMQAPTSGSVAVSGNTSPSFSGGKKLNHVEAYTLTPDPSITPQPNQGFHVTLTVNTTDSKGSDVKHKTFWFGGCSVPTTPPATSAPPCTSPTATATVTTTVTVTAQPAAARAVADCIATETVTVTDTVTPSSAPTSATTGTPTGGTPTLPTQTGGGNPESVFTPTAKATQSTAPQPGHVVIPTRIESGLATLPTAANTQQQTTDRWPLFALSGLCALLGGIGLLPRRRTSRRS